MEKKKLYVSTTLVYIRQEYKRFPKLGLAGLFFRIIVIVLDVFPALYYKDIINLLSTVTASNEIAANGIAILMYILWIKLVAGTLMRVFDYFFIAFEMDMQEDLYNRIFDYLQNHSFQFFSNNFTGSLISKVRKCVSSFERFTDIVSWDFLPFLLNILLVLIIIGLQNIWIAVGLFILVIIFAIVQYKLYLWVYPYQEKANALDTKLGGLLSDDITNNFNIKIFSSLDREKRDFAELAHKNTKAWKTNYYKSMWIWATSRVLSITLEIGTVYVAIKLR
jgi:ATP-binding cassette subfamily B protein